MDRELAVSGVSTMDQVFSESVSVRRQLTALMAFFSAVALVLAAVGLAGVMWYSVSQRTHEIGVRMTFGARQADILQLVLRRGLSLTLAGIAIGLGVAIAVTRMLASYLYGVSPNDPTAFALAPVVLVSVALLASYIPARRAARVDPIQALRCE
jgi:putative ABC transport system permease protein